MSALFLGLALALPLILGAAVLRSLGLALRADRLGFLGQAWCAGALATAGVVFVLAWVPGAVSAAPAPAAGVVLLTLVLAFRARRVEPAAPCPAVRGTRAEGVVFGVVVVVVLALVALRILAATAEPVMTDDEGNFWALKAKMIHLAGGFGAAFDAAAHGPNVLYNADYPNLNPLLQVWVFGWMGRIVHVANRLPIQLFALAQVLIAAAALRRVARPWIAAAALIALVAPAEAGYQAGLAHGDLLVGTGLLLALDAWWRWRATGEGAFFRLACLAAGIVLWSKNDGQVWLVSFALALALAWGAARLAGVRGERRSAPWAWLLLPAGVVAAHTGFNARFGFASGFLHNELRDEGLFALLVRQLPERGGVVARFFTEHVLLSVDHSGAVFAVLLVAVVAGLPALVRRPEVLAPALAVLGGLAALGLIFVGAPHDVGWHLHTAAGRVAFQLQPAAVLVLARLAQSRRAGAL